jgi:glucose-1-phosphate adenylyltransferase
MHNVLVLILGGGQGSRLFPLTHMRSKPAVPVGGKYRLIDVPVSLCLHAEMRRIFVLTQFNSASLNRHIAQTYRLDLFTDGFVEILAAEQTPESRAWFQGTADAVRQAMRHFVEYDVDYYLILAGDHLYRMDLRELVRAHVSGGADVTIAAQPVGPDDATSMGIFRFDGSGRISGFEEKPDHDRLATIGRSVPDGSAIAPPDPSRPFVASMGIYVFTRQVLIDLLERHQGVDFGREIIPAAIDTKRAQAYFYDGYWADVGTIESFYDANISLTRPRTPFSFYDPTRPIYTHQRFLPGSRFNDCRLHDSIVAEGCQLTRCDIHDSVVGIRTLVSAGARISRSVLLGADRYEQPDRRPDGVPPVGIGRDAVLDRVIVDKNARIGDGVRLVNEANVAHADGDGYVIRNGIIIVPKNGVVPAGTVV